MVVAYEMSPLCTYSQQSPTTCALSSTDPNSLPENAQYVHGVLCVVPLVRSQNGNLEYSSDAFTNPPTNTLCQFNTVNLAEDTPLPGQNPTYYTYGKARCTNARPPLPRAPRAVSASRSGRRRAARAQANAFKTIYTHNTQLDDSSHVLNGRQVRPPPRPAPPLQALRPCPLGRRACGGVRRGRGWAGRACGGGVRRLGGGRRW